MIEILAISSHENNAIKYLHVKDDLCIFYQYICCLKGFEYFFASKFSTWMTIVIYISFRLKYFLLIRFITPDFLVSSTWISYRNKVCHSICIYRNIFVPGISNMSQLSPYFSYFLLINLRALCFFYVHKRIRCRISCFDNFSSLSFEILIIKFCRFKMKNVDQELCYIPVI